MNEKQEMARYIQSEVYFINPLDIFMFIFVYSFIY